ncbi:MAG: class I SAM-dependent methyltransferase [Syntrophobacteraceae bacterium]
MFGKLKNQITRLFRRRKNASGFIFHVDSPKELADFLKPSITFSGWIVSLTNEEISEGRIVITEPNTSIDLKFCKPPGVEHDFPGHPCAGFSRILSPIQICSVDAVRIEFRLGAVNKCHEIKVDTESIKKTATGLAGRKKEKLERIKDYLICPSCRSEQLSHNGYGIECTRCKSCYSSSDQSYNFLSREMINHGNIEATENVSANDYDSISQSIIERLPEGLILEIGCGLRSVYYPNVINFEIVDYPTTDVLGIGERLPFKSDTFDAVFSLNVFEHLRNPFESASEIMRVLKPGGELYVTAPFLQPFHGYPNHYYNMTAKGLENLFGGMIDIQEQGVPLSGSPIWALNWILNYYCKGLPKDVVEKFRNMKVKHLTRPINTLLEKDYVNSLDPGVREELACTNYIVAKKKGEPDR